MTKTIVKSVEKRWLSSRDAQQYLGMGKDFFDRLREEALIHYYRVGRCGFYEKSDIDNLIIKNRIV